MKTVGQYYQEVWNLDHESYKKQQLRRARITALALGGSTIISLLFLVFAFIQKNQADNAKEQAVRSKAEVVSLQAELEKCRSGNN